MIEHTVTFRLKHGSGSPEESAFLTEAAALAAIPKVVDFTIRRQTSPKLDHTFGISMRFATRADYDAYNTHPDHLAFLEKRWFPEVEAFQEADFESL
ncbi:MAG: Dabb family protein [Verrucomicrobiaceae bacterium]|nr:Dabb family protein [Verrucomicrobiaceae bacterium]